MALSRITEAVASFTDLTIGDDLTLTDDFLMASDASIIKFGADADVTLTHVHNTGLLLNSTSVIQFNDSSQNIGAPNATTLDINATDEELIDLIKKRSNNYSKALYEIKCDNLSKNQIVKKVLEIYETH